MSWWWTTQNNGNLAPTKICLIIATVIVVLIVVLLLVILNQDDDLPLQPFVITFKSIEPSDNRGRKLTTQCDYLSTTERIVGGTAIGVFEHPWLALIGYKTLNGSPMGYFCGGMLINNRYVLTAGHCLKNFFPDNKILVDVVTLGDHNLTNTTDCEGVFTADAFQDIEVEELVIHPKYSKNPQYDIGLIRLARNANLKVNNVKPICLMRDNVAKQQQESYSVTGWGMTVANSNNSLPDEPQMVELYKKTREFCGQKWNQTISEAQVCFGGEHGKDACNGDSGNPLVRTFFNGTRGVIFAEGIVSSGTLQCGTEGVPGKYVNIPYFIDWIEANLRP